MASLRQRLEAHQPDALLSSGVAPHAPYSVSPDLYRASAEWRRTQSAPMTTHIAETLQEILFIESGAGEFRDFLSSLGLMPAGWSAPGLSPVPYLHALGVLESPVLLAHCNYLDAESLQIILKTHCSVVYCPRSHAFFGHAPHPVRQLLDIGVNVALGTDSLASNDTLSILDEMRFLAKLRPDLKPDEILRMATLNGAAALQFGGALGRIRRGYLADFTVVRLPEEVGAKNLAAQILEGAGECVGAIVQGQVVWKEHCVEPTRV
jgi:cytosine/adenosine deaminase-related metal-dependent hydrolase